MSYYWGMDNNNNTAAATDLNLLARGLGRRGRRQGLTARQTARRALAAYPALRLVAAEVGAGWRAEAADLRE